MIEAGVAYAMKPAKFKHLFDNTGHLLGPLIAKCGNEINTIRTILIAAQNFVPISGQFDDLPIHVEGFTVYIRGVVIDDIIKLGTIFIKEGM